jgi:thioredoxin reductase
MRPEQAPAEDFHRSITEFLREWRSQRGEGFEAVRVIGKQWSARSQELRDLFGRHRVPMGFYDVASAQGSQVLRQLGLTSADLPVVELRFGSGQPALAAVSACSEGLRTLVIEHEAIGGQAGTSSMIRNYPGFSQGISGSKLAQETWRQAWTFGTTFLYMRRAESLSRTGDHYRLRLSDGSELATRTVAIATGASYRRLGIPQLEDLQGRGVFYGAAASEAPAMRGRNVFVAGGGNSAGQTALHMAKWANHVTVLVRATTLAESMSDYLIRLIAATPNIDVSYHVQVADGTGADHLQSLVLRDTVSGARRSVQADALFILIGSLPRTQWLGDSMARDQWGFILTGPDLPAGASAGWSHRRSALALETSLPGVFAAGELRRGSVKRVASAVGEGAGAIPLVHRYLETTATAPAVAVA